MVVRRLDIQAWISPALVFLILSCIVFSHPFSVLLKMTRNICFSESLYVHNFQYMLRPCRIDSYLLNCINKHTMQLGRPTHLLSPVAWNKIEGLMLVLMVVQLLPYHVLPYVLKHLNPNWFRYDVLGPI